MYIDDMVLSPLVEKKLENLYIKFAMPEIDKATRRKLYELGEEKTLPILLRIDQFPVVTANISAVIQHLTTQKQHEPSPRLTFSSSTTAVLSPSQHASASSSSREMSRRNRWDVEIGGLTEEDLLAMMNQEGTPVNVHRKLLHEPEYSVTIQQKIVPGAVAVAMQNAVASSPPGFPPKSSQGSNGSGDLLLFSPERKREPNEFCSTPKTPPLPKSASNSSRKRTGDGFLGTEDRNVKIKDGSGGRHMTPRKLDASFVQETTTNSHSPKNIMAGGGTSISMTMERLQELEQLATFDTKLIHGKHNPSDLHLKHMNVSNESVRALQTPSVSRNSFGSCIQETNAASPFSRVMAAGCDSSGLPAQRLQEHGQQTVYQSGVMNFGPQLQDPEIFHAEHRKVGGKNVQVLPSATPHVQSRDPSLLTSYRPVPNPVVLQPKMASVFKWPDWTDQLRAFGDLEFTKRFLIHSYATESEAMPPLEELKKLKRLDLEEVDKRLHNRFERPAHHTVKRDWSKVELHCVFSCTINNKCICKFSGPTLEIGSTPLQHAFGDENVLRVSFEDTSNYNDVRLQYQQLAREGILCGLKRFIFYGYKDAQAKKKQGITKNLPCGVKCIFVSIESRAAADLKSPTYRRYETIRDAQNYMMHPTVPSFAKSVSRLQLALSETVQISLDFDKIKVEIIQDVYCRDEEGNIVYGGNGKPLIHTDGIGYVSKNLAILCQDIVIKGCKQPHLEKQDYPLMMQIRLFFIGNVGKGVLLVNCLLPDDTIQVRESMLKVKRDDRIRSPTFNSLELCNTSRRPGTAKLFQHLILLLKKGGVPEEVFINFAETAVEDIKTCFKSREAAMRVAWDNAKDNNNGELAYRMLGAGLMPNIEPFLYKILWDMVKGRLQDFSKGKVPVPKSKYLIGCSDPTGLLERNQVAIVLEDGPIYRDKVLVYKPPGLHLGDVHVFEATWHKQIGEYVGNSTYGLYFPAKGARSVPDEMAGSDLDGDQYWVCWNDKIVDNFSPSPAWQACLDPTPAPPLRSDDDAEFQMQHFDKFLKARFNPSFIKGQAANNWLALTDYTMQSQDLDENQRTSVLRKISELVDLFYKALDADKSGEEVEWIPRLKPQRWPHFMEKNKDEPQRTAKCGPCGLLTPKKTKFPEYKSSSIIGKLHDLVTTADFDCPTNDKFDLDNKFEYEGYIQYFEPWKTLFRRYKGVMQQNFNSSDDYGTRNYQSEDLLAFYTEIFLHGDCALVAMGKEKDQKKIEKSHEQLLAEASAIYAAVYDIEKRKDKGDKALQFAWKVAGSLLCKLYARSHGAGIPFVMSSDALKEVIGSRR